MTNLEKQRAMKIIEAKAKTHGEPVVGLVGDVTKVSDVRKGEGDWGPYTVQTFELVDDSGCILVNVWNRDNIINLQGKTVRISAVGGDKGLGGASIVHREYQGNKHIEIKLTPTGALEIVDAPTTSAHAPSAGGSQVPGGVSQSFPERIPWAVAIRAASLAAEIAARHTAPELQAAFFGSLFIAVVKGQIALPVEDNPDESVPF